MPPLVDIHCHPLPELDDGALNWDEALAMARLAVEDGITCIVATTHQLGGYGHIHGDMIRNQAAQLQQRLDQQGVKLKILPGAEIRIEADLVPRLKGGDLLSMADRCRHVLLELPPDVYFPIQRVLAEIKAAGMVGILAHPERNPAIRSKPEILAALVRGGCLLQVTGGSLLGAFGPDVQQFTARLIQQGLVCFVSSDAHGSRARRPLLARTFQAVAGLVDETAAIDLLSRNPRCVAEGRDVTSARPASRRSSPSGWFFGRKAG
ncbi:MAG: CpsB/CapC family capsule biosynthesis tyrosine phosphatase [Thermoguttaceae bacterium]|jgi:protein-tyrosine phosphatase